MQFTKSKKVAAVLGAGAVAVAGSGVAFAYWTTTASGSGTAAAGTNAAAAPLVITQTVAGTPSGLVPGGSAQDVKVTVENTASYSQAVGSISATPTYPAGCGASNWTVTPVSNTGAILAAGATSSAITVATVALNDLGTSVNQNGCKDAVVNFAFAG